MATIRSALSLYDGMTGPLQSIHKALNIVLNSFEAVQSASGNAIDSSAIQEAREELARAGSQLDEIQDNIREADRAQDQFNDRVRDGANAADDLGGKLKGILATVISIAGVKSALDWVKENLELADTQRNAENQLKAVLANMGVEDIEIPVTVETNTDEAIENLNTYADKLNALEDSKITGSVALDAGNATTTLDNYSDRLKALDGSAVENAVKLDAGSAMNGLNAYSDRLETLNGGTIKNTLELASGGAVNALDSYSNMAGRVDGSAINTALMLETEGTLTTAKLFDDWKNRTDGRTIQNTLILDSVNAMAGMTAYNDRLNVLDKTTAKTTIAVALADSMINVNNFENTLEALDGQKVNSTINANTSSAIKALNQYNRAANAVDGSTVQTMLNMDNGQAITAAMEYEEWANRTDGRTIQNTLLFDRPDDVEVNMNLNTGRAVTAYTDFVNAVDGNTVTTNVAVDTTQTMSAFDAIAAKASEIQGRGIYGDEAMIAGAAEFATYFSDAEAIMSMMDTLSDYAMGMSGGGALDTTAMVDYATNLGKIMTGAYDAMTKKGFEFSDAQKAVIDGTATHAQYVEALGEDYQSMSEDMRAATVINSIIAESWDGLYEAMSNTPEGKIIQFNNTLGDMREVLGNRVYPAVLQFFDVFTNRFPEIERLLTWFSDGCSVLIAVLTWLADAALTVTSAFVDNWGWIGPIIYGIAGALAVYHAWMLAVNTVEAISKGLKIASAAAAYIHAAATGAEVSATAAATAAQYGLNTALYACPIVWVVMLVIALIAAFYAAVAAVNKFAGTSVSATGIICGAFMAALAFIGNIFVALWNIAVDVFVLIYNLVATVANFIGNVFVDPVGAVARLFFDLADTVLGVLESLASAIDTIFGSNLAGAVSGWRNSLGSWVDSTFGKGEEIMEKMNGDDLKLGRFEYSAAFDLGYKFGEGIEDTVGGLFKTPTLDEMGLDSVDAFNLGNSLDGIYGNTGDTAANTAATADTLDYMDEDLAWMKDIAEREAINRYVTAEITVEQHNENHISKDTDLDGVMDAFCYDFAEKLDVSAEGVHE